MPRIIDELKVYLAEQMMSQGIDSTQVIAMIDLFAEEEQKKYDELKKDRKLSFGKYRGYTVRELALTQKGKDYLSWLLGQGWFVEKNKTLVEEIGELGIKKKSFKRTPLE